ncbi:MAG: Pyridoxine/pyridoxamine 5'-phosphate oxidase [Hyphomonas sp. TMED17]|nr:MAG: Pyridoxine/pyridoxamine 5'-phosphate oxidase [Hyphomonas sp. TMED17]
MTAIPPSPSPADYQAEDNRPRIPDIVDPFAFLEQWLVEANASEPNDSSAAALATVDADGFPDVRIVLVRGLSAENGLSFYTNYDSAKGRQLAENPRASLCFHWKSLRRQVRVRGAVERASEAESDAYFGQRAVQSRIAAIASDQSRPMPDREAFEARMQEIQGTYHQDSDIPRPAHWGGFQLKPDVFEFWQDQKYRTHDRLQLQRGTNGWSSQRLYP